MPQPVGDNTTGWWSIRVRQPDGTRKKYNLAKQPGWKLGKPLPKKPPTEIILLAQKYQTIALQIRHGVDLAVARNDDLKTFLASYQTEHAEEHRPNSVRCLAQAAREFLAYCEDHSVQTVQAVTPEVCGAYMRARRKKGIARTTVRVERSYLAPAWSKAVMARTLTENPWKLSPTPGKAEKKEPEFWREDELKKLVAASPPWLRDIILFAANTGARITSILTLEWKYVHFDRNMIRFHSKTGPYEVPMNIVSRPSLERLQFLSKSKYVFPAAKADKPKTSPTVYSAIHRIAKKAEIPMRGSYNHILRHTFASLAIMDGKSIFQVSKWLGHSNIQTTMIYSHLSTEESQRQMSDFQVGVDPPQPPETPSGEPEPSPPPPFG